MRDAPAPPALVDQPGRARCRFVGDDDRRDVVAQLDGQLKGGLGREAGAEIEGRFADRPPLRVQRAHDAAWLGVTIGAGKSRLEGAGLALEAGDGERRLGLRSDGDGVIRRQPLQPRCEAAGAAEFETVGDPQDFRFRIGGEEALNRRRRGGALGRIGFWLQRREFRGERCGVERLNVLAARRHRGKRDQATGIGGLTRRLARGLEAALPIGRGRPAVVNHDEQRAPVADGALDHVPQRPRHRQRHRGGGEDAQRQQRPRRLGRGWLLLDRLNSSRSGGKGCSRGRGGVMRSSQ